MLLLDLRGRSFGFETKIRIFHKLTKITIYGSYYPPVKNRLINLVDKLRKEGYEDVDIVERRENIKGKDGQFLGADKKSEYYMENSDYNIFLYLKEGAKAGLGIELKYAIGYDHIIKKSLVVIEMINEVDDTEKIVTEILKDNENWNEIEKVKVPLNNDKNIFEKVKSYLLRRFWEGINEKSDKL